MAGVRIVTDSACDLAQDVVEELDVSVVPLTIRFGDEELVDREELSASEFYRRLATSPVLPETAAPSPGAFEKVFRRLAGEGADAVVCVNLSSDLSATMQSAQNAAKALEGDVDVRVVDSRSITATQGILVMEAARAARDGGDADSVVALLESLAERTRLFGALDTLDYLRKGGRIGGAQALLGTLLSVKPVLDLSTGTVQEAAKPRTRKKALAWLRDKVLEQPSVEHLAVAHGDAPDLDEFLDMLAPRYSRDEIRVGPIGAVIGTHGGPRVIGVGFLVPR